MRFDRQKVSDLENIQYQTIFYWQSKERLPQKLEDLGDPISGYKAPADPQTDKSYEYVLKSENEFELCADFNLASESQPGAEKSGPYPVRGISNWEHSAGKVCFERKIDEELYPPFKRKID
jgi:hypothetical protein